MDLGVSSPQFDDETRGFSYRNDAILDMRMNQEQTLTAKDIVNTYSLEDLTHIFKEYGEDKYSYQIAKEIVKSRLSRPINTTFDLVELIKKVKPNKELAKKGHPAKQIFQALRIEVNDEINNLKNVLDDVLNSLNEKGRLAVITFHSLEDRIVKEKFKSLTSIIGSRHNVYTRPEDEQKLKFKLINKKPIVATMDELNENNRSKSAKLRVIEKL